MDFLDVNIIATREHDISTRFLEGKIIFAVSALTTTSLNTETMKGSCIWGPCLLSCGDSINSSSN